MFFTKSGPTLSWEGLTPNKSRHPVAADDVRKARTDEGQAPILIVARIGTALDGFVECDA